MLELAHIPINKIDFGNQTGIDQGCFSLNTNELQTQLCKRDSRITRVEVYICAPGESVRIVCVKDVVEPRCKVGSSSSGVKRQHVLKNMAVITCGQIVGFQEGIIDMSGPGAMYSPFSKTHNVVVDISVQSGLSAHEHEESVRTAGLAAAEYLGEAARFIEPESTQLFSLSQKQKRLPALPRVVYVYPLLTQGLLHDSYLNGINCCEGLPQVIEPSALLAGAIVSGNCVSACDKNTTYHHQNNPIIHELFSQHGKTLFFAGVVLSCEPVRLASKEQAAEKTVELVKEIGCDGVILTKEGFGNPDTDQMLLIDGLEAEGIRCCGITDEFAGADGNSQSLADVSQKADAMVSVGNANERVFLPPMDRLIGPFENVSQLAGAYPQSIHDDGSLEIELQGIIGATNEFGFSHLSCREI